MILFIFEIDLLRLGVYFVLNPRLNRLLNALEGVCSPFAISCCDELLLVLEGLDGMLALVEVVDE